MKLPRITTLAALTLIFLFAEMLRAEEGQEFKPFASKSGHFTASFPGDPKENVVPIMNRSVKTDVHTFMVVRKDGKEVYMVSYTEVQVDLAKTASADPDKVLDFSRDAQMTGMHGKLTKETKISIDGNPGRELRAQLKIGTVMCRTYLVKKKWLYQVIVIASDEPSADATKFLNSFKLTKE